MPNNLDAALDACHEKIEQQGIEIERLEDVIRAHWRGQAAQPGHAASWSDRYAIELETQAIAARLADGTTVLDVGCGNGWATEQLAAMRKITIHGIDYLPEMIEQARRRNIPRATFSVGDVRRIEELGGAFNVVVCRRVLINLGSVEDVRAALGEFARVLEPGGMLLLAEATVQGWAATNALRTEFGLAEIPMPAFNRYLDEPVLLRDAAAVGLVHVETACYSSTYFVLTRCIKPLLMPGQGANPLSGWNRWAASLPPWGSCGTQRLMVFRK